MDRVHGRVGAGWRRRNALRTLGEYSIALAEIHFQDQRIFGCVRMLNETIDIQARMRGQHVFRPGENILDKGRGHDAKRNFAVNAAEGQVVNLITERGNIRPLAGVNIHDECVLPVEIDVRCEIERKR